MDVIPDSELILNPDGSIYHLGLQPDEIAATIIGVGDPDRVAQVSRHFDVIETEKNKREFVTHTGRIGNQRLTVISTGIGTDNTEIVLTELDALLNIDLKQRVPHPQRKKLKIIRIGTSGALQEDIPVGAHVVANYAVGLDNLMEFYPLTASVAEERISRELQTHTQLSFSPYCVQGSDSLITSLAPDLVKGTTLTAPGFYAPQGRSVVLGLKYPNLLSRLASFNLNGFRITNLEMETSAYYGLGKLLGHEVISLNAILANRFTKQFSPDPQKLVEELIVKTLDRLSVN